MADGTFPGIISANRDLNAADNVIYVQLSDGTSTLGITSGSLDVNVTNTSITVTGSVDISTPSGTSITVDGTVNIGNTVTVQANDLDIRDLSHTQDSVRIGDGTDLLGVNTDGSINVNVIRATLSDEIHDYDLASAVAGSGTSNHDYTVVGSTVIITGIYIAASGDAKFEIQKDDGGGLTTIAVAFTTGKQGDSKLVEFPTPLEATTSIRIIKTNRENQAQDLYSTIIGRDVA